MSTTRHRPAITAATLYVVPGSHPSMAGRLMLEHKRISYRRIDLLPAIHKPLLRMLGFADTTVPALQIDGRRIQNSILTQERSSDCAPSRRCSRPINHAAPLSNRPSAGARRSSSRSRRLT